MKPKRLLTILLFTTSSFIMAQGLKPCGSDEARLDLITKNPQILQDEQHAELFGQGFKVIADTTTVYTIPIVFHILHNYGLENISDAQVIDAVRILNDDYGKTNADYTQVQSPFHPANAKIQFRLAQKDPSGNCTNGIDRIASMQTFVGNDGSKLNGWPRSKYLNIWVVAKISSGAAGYAYFPSTVSSSLQAGSDGIMILNNYIGSIGTSSAITSRSLTHEIGHWANLYHVWGNGNGVGVACGDDGVTDTPITKGWSTCNLTSNKVCNSGIVENVENYMEYAYCAKMFTQGQCARMRTALTSTTAQRSSLWTTTNLAATGITTPTVFCNADFIGNKTLVCENDIVVYNDNASNANPAFWNWTFQGGSPATSTNSTPNITYPTAGTYNTSLSVSDGSSTATTTKTGYITVSPLTAKYNTANWTEGFEGSQAALNNEWILNDVDKSGNSWQANGIAKYAGSYSMWINNWQEDSSDVEEIISPSVNPSLINTPKLYFKIAYAQITTNDADNLKIWISKDCGKTWFLKYNKSGGALKSVSAPITSPFYPTSTAQWRSDSLTVTGAYATATNLRFKFYWFSANGNNVFIDDLNMHGLATGVKEDLGILLGFQVMPNPADGYTNLSFDLPTSANVSLKLYDILGKDVATFVDQHNLPTGLHQYEFDCSSYNKGIYFAKLTVGGRQFVQKVVVK